MKKFVILCSAGLFFFSFCNLAHATNGFKTAGVGAINRAMAGAGVAAPQDTNTIIINPAGLSQVGSRFDFSMDVHMPETTMDTDGSALGNTGAGKQESGRDPSLIPTGGYSHRIKDTNWTLGFGMFGLAGCGVDYVKSRTGAGAGNLNNNYDKFTDYQFMTVASSAAYQVNDKLSLGLAVNFDYQTFDTDALNGSMAQTSGQGRLDHSYGAGFALGAIYDLTPKVALGVNYTSKQWMDRFEYYQDVVPRLDMAQQVQGGIALRPSNKWLVAFDVKWINWSGISVLGEEPSKGGFGWRDQTVYALGGQYKLTDKVFLRGGYSYGKSPIGPDRVFANALFPAVGEHHLGCGVGVEVAKNTELSLTYEHAFSHKMVDNGLGDTYSVNGKGSSVSFACNAIITQLSIKF